jgi:tight adherence protein B
LVERFIQAPVTMALVVAAVALAIGAAVAVFAGQRTGTLRTRVGRFVSVSETPARKARGQLAQQVREQLERGANGLQGLNVWQRIQATLELADIKLGAGPLVALTLAATILVALLLSSLVGALGVLLSLGTPLFARGAVRAKLAHKRRRFAEQLPDCLDVLASSLRAGHALVSAFSVVVENVSEPAKSEFQRVISEEQLGVPLEDALQLAVIRMQSRDLDQVALVARLQREMGSNSAEVLDQVAENVRGRVELRGQVQTLTAQGRLSRWILTALPIVLAVALSAIDPGYLSPLFHHGGRLLLVAAALMVIAGSLVIRKIVDIKA